MRRTIPILVAACLVSLTAAAAHADDTAMLIELDKKWGEAGMAGDADAMAKFVADDVVAMTPMGMGDKAMMLADLEPAPAGATYEATDYKVTFLDDQTAIMTHSVKGEGAHHSMHVWSKRSGEWKVAATAEAPAMAPETASE